MEHNAYQAPESSIIEDNTTQVNNEEIELASRWRRLGASIIDGFIMLIPSLIIMYFVGSIQNIMDGTLPSIQQVVILFISAFFLHIIINFKPLKENGQTLGKKALGIKVVTLENLKPSLANLVFKRYLFFMIIGEIPIIGGTLSTINLLLIFKPDKRCGHDLIAGTQVINC